MRAEYKGQRSIPLRPRSRSKGFVLIALLVLLTMGGLYFLVSNLTPEAMEVRRQEKTSDSLARARDALMGYVLKYREDQSNDGQPDRVYGYLPMPDLGKSRATTTDPKCRDANGRILEGCEAYNASGIANLVVDGIKPTIIGRLPWRSLGIEPLRDGHGECLWLIVSSHHLAENASNSNSRAMNWDTLGQLDIVQANGGSSLISTLANAHDRPVAIIYAPGPAMSGQDRSPSVTDYVDECGGNYEAKNYLDPATVLALGGTTNYLDGTNSANDTLGHDERLAAPKKMIVGGKIFKEGSNFIANNCLSSDCALLANDVGLPIRSSDLFGAIRKNGNFRTDINTMLDRMSDCLRDQIVAGTGFTPMTLAEPSVASNMAAGRIYSSPCFDDTASVVNTVNPKGYFKHYKDQIFVAACPGTQHSVVVDSATTSCAGALAFSGPRNPQTQSRTSTAERNTISNYLEDDIVENGNLSAFSTLLNTDYASCATAKRFAGDGTFASLASGQKEYQDIVRCIPAGPSLNVVASTVTASAGAIQLAQYAPATGTLTLGSASINSNYGAPSAQLFACAWTPEVHASGSGFRSYFRFRIRRVGEGFTFAVIDGDRNTANACGASRQHLGYSGDSGNVLIPYIAAPKLAIEFDTARNCNSSTFDSSGRPACTFTESGSTLSNGRNDPCYTSSCGGQGLDNSSHVAVVYWGYGSALTYPLQDDNVHDQLGLPMPTDPSSHPGPRNPAPVLPYVTNPATIPGIAPLDRMGGTTVAFREFHARLELTRSFTSPLDPKDGITSVQVKFWIEAHPAANISAMSYNSGSPPTLSVTTSSAHNLSTGDTVVIKDAVPIGYNGEYPITKIDATHFTATLPSGTADPGRYISAITWTNIDGSTDQATVTSANHGLSNGNSITITGAIPTEYNGTYTINSATTNSYKFGLELDYEPGDMAPSVAAAKALTPRATALANTTRPMSELDATAKAYIADTATIYDEQKSACAASAPLCPNGQSCGSDGMCYRPSFRNIRLGYTLAERASSSGTARGQLIEIKDRATTWLP